MNTPDHPLTEDRPSAYIRKHVPHSNLARPKKGEHHQGTVISRALNRLGMSQHAAAKRVGIAPPVLNRIVNNRGVTHYSPFTKDDTVYALAHVLQISPDDLYIASNRIPPDVADHLIEHPELLNVVRRLANKLDGETVNLIQD